MTKKNSDYINPRFHLVKKLEFNPSRFNSAEEYESYIKKLEKLNKIREEKGLQSDEYINLHLELQEL